jgi:predicted RNA binding protein YcfA (HicA-like mRNA interferase family)
MGKRQKLIEKARRNSAGLRFGEFETLLANSGWTFDHQTGGHRIWYSPGRHRLPIQETKNGKAKEYQVRQFLKQYEQESGNEE